MRFGVHRCLLLVDGVVDVQVDESVEVAGPAVAAGVVADWASIEAGDHGDEAVDVALLGDAGLVQQLDRRGPSASSASAYDSGDGSKPGTWRWNSSSQRAGSSTAKSTNAPMTLLQRGARVRGSVELRRAARAAAGCRRRTSRRTSACLESKYS